MLNQVCNLVGRIIWHKGEAHFDNARNKSSNRQSRMTTTLQPQLTQTNGLIGAWLFALNNPKSQPPIFASTISDRGKFECHIATQREPTPTLYDSRTRRTSTAHKPVKFTGMAAALCQSQNKPSLSTAEKTEPVDLTQMSPSVRLRNPPWGGRSLGD